MKTPNIIQIQRFSIHDGEGIRTTVFFKGCPLSCLWCHNPESQRYEPEMMYHADGCVRCLRCLPMCKQQGIAWDDKNNRPILNRSNCIQCGSCVESCMGEALKIAGKHYSVEELIKILKKDTVFYENSHGGITLSGGEVMTQDMDYIANLMEKLTREGYRINVDTCGYAPYKNFERILPYTDTFLYDLKIIDSSKHRAYTGCDNQLILDNIRKLSARNAKINIRIPVIEGINADKESMQEIITFLQENIKVDKVNLLPYHETGKGKYLQLDRQYHNKELQIPDDSKMHQFVALFMDANFKNVYIGG